MFVFGIKLLVTALVLYTGCVIKIDSRGSDLEQWMKVFSWLMFCIGSLLAIWSY